MSIKLWPALKYATRLCSEYRLDLVQASPPLWSSPLHYSNYHITSLHPFSSITTTPPPQPLHQSTLSLTPCGWEGPSFGEGVSWITGFRLIHHPACRGWFKAKYPEHTEPQENKAKELSIALQLILKRLLLFYLHPNALLQCWTNTSPTSTTNTIYHIAASHS